MDFLTLHCKLSNRSLGKFTSESAALKQALNICIAAGVGKIEIQVCPDGTLEITRPGTHLIIEAAPRRTRHQYLYDVASAAQAAKQQVLRFSGRPSSDGWVAMYREEGLDLEVVGESLKLKSAEYAYFYLTHGREVIDAAKLPSSFDMVEKINCADKSIDSSTIVKMYWDKFLAANVPSQAAGLVIVWRNRLSGKVSGVAKRYVNGMPEPINKRG